MSNSPYHDIPPGYHSASSTAEPQLPYYTKARVDYNEALPDERGVHGGGGNIDEQLRESLTQFNGRADQSMPDADVGLSVAREQNVGEAGRAQQNSGQVEPQYHPAHVDGQEYAPQVHYAQQNTAQVQVLQHPTHVEHGHEYAPQGHYAQQDTQQHYISPYASPYQAHVNVGYSGYPDVPAQTNAPAYAPQFETHAQHAQHQDYAYPQQQYGYLQQHGYLQQQQYGHLQQNQHQQNQHQQDQHQQQYGYGYPTDGYGYGGQVNHPHMLTPPDAAAQLNTAMPAPQSTQPQQPQTFRYGAGGRGHYQLMPDGSERYFPAGGPSHIHTGQDISLRNQLFLTPYQGHTPAQSTTTANHPGHGQHDTPAPHLAGANLPGFTRLAPAPSPAASQAPAPSPRAQPPRAGGTHPDNPFGPPTSKANAPHAIPTPVPGTAQQLTASTPAPVLAPAPARRQGAQPYVRGQGRFPFKPVPARTPAPRVPVGLGTAIRRSNAAPVQGEGYGVQGQQGPQGQQGYQQPEQNLAGDFIDEIVQSEIDRRAHSHAQRQAQREEEDRNWRQTSQNVDDQLLELNQSLANAPQRQAREQSQQQNQQQGEEQPEQQSQSGTRRRRSGQRRGRGRGRGRPQTQQDQTQQDQTQQDQTQQDQTQQDDTQQDQIQQDVNVMMATDVPFPMAVPFFHGLSKDFEAPTPLASDSASVFKPMFPMFSKSTPDDESHTHLADILASKSPVENAPVATISKKTRKRSASKNPTAPAEGPPPRIGIWPPPVASNAPKKTFQQHRRKTSERLNVEAAKRGADHIDLTGAAPRISEKPEELHSAGHATSADPTYTAEMDTIRQNWTHAPEQAAVQESALTAPLAESTVTPEPASTPMMDADFSTLFCQSPFRDGPGPVPDSFDGAGSAPYEPYNETTTYPLSLAKEEEGRRSSSLYTPVGLEPDVGADIDVSKAVDVSETVEITEAAAVSEVATETEITATPEAYTASSNAGIEATPAHQNDVLSTKIVICKCEPSVMVYFKVDKEFLSNMKESSLEDDLPPVPRQSLIVHVALTPDIQTQFWAGRFPRIWNAQYAPNPQSIFPLRYNALGNGVRMSDVETGPTIQNAMNNFSNNHHQSLQSDSSPTTTETQTLHRTPYNPIHVESLGLPASFDHAEAITRVRSPEYDFSFSENNGVGPPLPDEEARELCTEESDGSLRAPEMPYDEPRANLEYELMQVDAEEVDVNHNDVTFDDVASMRVRQEADIIAIDDRIRSGAIDPVLWGEERVIHEEWLQGWVISDGELEESDEDPADWYRRTFPELSAGLHLD